MFYNMTSLIIGLFLNALLIELGHLLGAKLGGYEVYLCNILGFCFYKKEKDSKKKTFKFSEFDGISGETKVVLKKEKGNPRPYILLPILFILIEAIILLVFITLISVSRLGGVSSKFSICDFNVYGRVNTKFPLWQVVFCTGHHFVNELLRGRCSFQHSMLCFLYFQGQFHTPFY